MYGRNVGVTYEGEATFKTRLGSLMTLATYVLGLINLYNLSVQFVDKSAQKVNREKIKVDTLDMETQHLDSESFLIALTTLIGIPPDLGRLKAYQHQRGNQKYAREELKIGPEQCSEIERSRFDNFWSKRIQDTESLEAL